MEEYRGLARSSVIDLLEQEHAVVWPEVEAKLAERPHPLLPRGINPHHLTYARQTLIVEGIIEEIRETTRGGSIIPILALQNRHRKETVFSKAAARKRLLHARYRSWTKSSAHKPNMIADAGERVVHASLILAAQAGAGYRIIRSTAGQVANLFGEAVPGGPLDNAAFLTILDQIGFPIPVTLLIEVKNVRHWIYPASAELYQLLYKATCLQQRHADQLFVPVLIARQVHYTTFTLAKEAGFFVIPMKVQPILPHSDVSPKAVEEVRMELGYDLLQTEGPHKLITDALLDTIPKRALSIARHWQQVAPRLNLSTLQVLRNPSTNISVRSIELASLRRMVTLPERSQVVFNEDEEDILAPWQDDDISF